MLRFIYQIHFHFIMLCGHTFPTSYCILAIIVKHAHVLIAVLVTVWFLHGRGQQDSYIVVISMFKGRLRVN